MLSFMTIHLSNPLQSSVRKLLANQLKHLNLRLVRGASKTSSIADRTSSVSPNNSDVNHKKSFDTYENNYLFSNYELRLRPYDKLAGQHSSPQIDEILNSFKSGRATEQSNLKPLIETLDHQSLNSVLYHAIKSGIVIPRQILAQIDYGLVKLLAQNKPTSNDTELWFYSANLMYQTELQNPRLLDSFTRFLTTSNDILLSDQQFFHLLFLIVVKRTHYDYLSKSTYRMKRLLAKCKLVETATISSAYFKTRTKIEDTVLFLKIVDSILNNRKHINFAEPGFCSIIKLLRYSKMHESRKYISGMIETLFKEFNPSEVLVSSFNQVHVLKLMETYRIYDTELFDKISEMMFSNLDDYRIKDIQYILTSLSNFDYRPKDLQSNLDKLVEKIILENRKDSKMQYYHLIPILRAFCIFNYHNDDLMAYINIKMEDPHVVSKMSTVLEFDKSALLLYVSSRLGPGKISFSPNNRLLKMTSSSIDRISGNFGIVKPQNNSSLAGLQSVTKIEHLEMSYSLRVIAERLCNTPHLNHPQYTLYFQHTLPHQNYTDLVITNAGKELGSSDVKTYMPKFVPKDKKYVIVIMVRKYDFIDSANRLSGAKQLNIRLLQMLGYHVVTVNLDDHDINDVAQSIKLILDGDTQ